MQTHWVIPRSVVVMLVCVASTMAMPGAVSAETLERASVIEQRNAMHKLHAAVRVGDTDAVVAILKSGFDVNESEAMQLAILARNKDIIDVLIEHGADIDHSALSGEPPVITALRHDRIDIMKHLVRKGADINGRDLSGKTVLHHAGKQGDPVVIDYLKANGAFEGRIGRK